jgi:hypothetical protein
VEIYHTKFYRISCHQNDKIQAMYMDDKNPGQYCISQFAQKK